MYQLLSETFRGEFDRLKLFVLDPYDLAPSKLTRNLDIDVEDVKRLARSKNPTSICSRLAIGTNSDYASGPIERHDLTLRLWLDAIREEREQGERT